MIYRHATLNSFFLPHSTSSVTVQRLAEIVATNALDTDGERLNPVFKFAPFNGEVRQGWWEVSSEHCQV